MMRLLLTLLSSLGMHSLADAVQQTLGNRKVWTVRVHVDRAMHDLLADEDVDNDKRITVDDRRIGRSERGDKLHSFCDADGTVNHIRGTFFLSNLLQELSIAREQGAPVAEIPWGHIYELPVDRISRLIRERFWDGLTRRIDREGLERMLADTKLRNAAGDLYLYVPEGDTLAVRFYSAIARDLPGPVVQIRTVPRELSPEFLRSVDSAHGLLSLACDTRNADSLIPLPFVVPGGRFNEMYGWDSYFEVLGLLHDGLVERARAMVDHFAYEIRWYGKVLNANRTYYLTRSQPPFLTSMIRAVLSHLERDSPTLEWLSGSLSAALREHRTVWMGPERLMPSGLSRYWDSGTGPPPEVEPGHFDAIFARYAAMFGMPPDAFEHAYRSGKIQAPALDEYFKEDRAMRESGHDTSYRLVGCASRLSTVDLNCLLYKTETDIAWLIAEYFDDRLVVDGVEETSLAWSERAEKRKRIMTELMWDDRAGTYVDWNERTNARQPYVTPVALYPLWAGLATNEQAESIVRVVVPQLEAIGGLAGSSESSRGPLGPDREPRQWDYPFGWPPHQMLAWEGLQRYGYRDIAERLAYKWLFTIMRNAVDYNGTIPEKYDVVRRTHDVFAEYGNVGVKFAYITKEGFGWMNASYLLGLSVLTDTMRNALNDLRPPEELFGAAPER